MTILFLLSISNGCSESVNEKGAQDCIDTVLVHDTLLIRDTLFLKKVDVVELPYVIMERLPDWIRGANVLSEDLKILGRYEFDQRLNPLYLEADFNGDGNLDVAIPIKEIKSGKMGYAIVHGKSKKVHIVGAGITINNCPWDDFDFHDVWKVNHDRVNGPGVDEETGTGKDGELILKTPSIRVIKLEVGGGLIYWNGKEYAYFHQTC